MTGGLHSSKAAYRPFTAKAAFELASPPTWVAAVMPTLVAAAATLTLKPITPVAYNLRTLAAWALMLVTAVLMQSAVNTLNDYKDFTSGLDTAQTIYDKKDASIVYNQLNPRDALTFSVVLLGVAAVFGLAVVWLSSWHLLVVGLVAAAIVVLYSVGPKPISSLPLGELFSGVVMGGLITWATYYAMALSFTPLVLTVTVVPIITVALIMQTNNTCDIQRDIQAGRHTLPVLLGMERSANVARVLAWITVGYMVVWVAACDVVLWRSLPLLLVDMGVALVLYLVLKKRIARIGQGPYTLKNRGVMMGNITRFCRTANLSWGLVLVVCWAVGDLLARYVDLGDYLPWLG